MQTPATSASRPLPVLKLLAGAHLACGFLVGLVAASEKGLGLAETFLGVLTMASIYVWCRSDAVRRNDYAAGRWPLWAALFPPVLLPVLFFRTRKWPRALRSTGKALGFYLAVSLLFLLGVLVGTAVHG